MKRKLTAKALEYLHAPGSKRLDVWDTVLQGFGVRVSPTGRKVWSVVVRPDGAPRRITIGTYPAISLAQARQAAGKIIADVQLGVFDRSNEAPTLEEFIQGFSLRYTPNLRTAGGKTRNDFWAPSRRFPRSKLI